jgi:hypothetical protein
MNKRMQLISEEIAQAEQDKDWVLVRSLMAVRAETTDVTIGQHELNNLLAIGAQDKAIAQRNYVQAQAQIVSRNNRLQTIAANDDDPYVNRKGN